MRFTMFIVSLGVGSLAFTQGCGSSPLASGLWSCFDTGAQTACTQVSALSTADRDVNGDGVPDHFVCADDDNDGHDRGRDHDQSGLRTGSGSDEDHDGLDDDLDCDHRHECESLSNDANPDRHDDEIEASTTTGATTRTAATTIAVRPAAIPSSTTSTPARRRSRSSRLLKHGPGGSNAIR